VSVSVRKCREACNLPAIVDIIGIRNHQIGARNNQILQIHQWAAILPEKCVPSNTAYSGVADYLVAGVDGKR